ncbi:MAG TPA: hypothetical protein VK210_01200, partial [Terriglobia bacterium]|nr:hypothetical protein [Terriglobia bacterium]
NMVIHWGQSPFHFLALLTPEPIVRLAFFSYIVNSWDRRGGAKRRGGSQIEKFPLALATTPRGIRFAIPLPIIF